MANSSTPEQSSAGSQKDLVGDDHAASMARTLLGEVDFEAQNIAPLEAKRIGPLSHPAFDGMPKSLASVLLRGIRENHGRGNWPI